MLDLSNFKNTYSHKDSVNFTAPDDTYKFKITEQSNLNISFSGLSAPINWLLKDSNDRILSITQLDPLAPQVINFNNLGIGNYSLEVQQAGSETNYKLTIDSLTGVPFESGFFDVHPKGEVGFDLLLVAHSKVKLGCSAWRYSEHLIPILWSLSRKLAAELSAIPILVM